MIEFAPSISFQMIGIAIEFAPDIRLEKVNVIIDIAPKLTGQSNFTFGCSYNTYDPDFDKVQLLLHLNDATGTKKVSDIKGHYIIGLKQAEAVGSRSKSVILLDGADYGGIDISPNNALNTPSSFNLYQDNDDVIRASNVDWCFECFISDQNSLAFTTGGYLASSSYSSNIENNYNNGVDWGIRLETGKIVVVIGDIDYPFETPTGYAHSQWEYIRVYREDNALGCWLGTNFLGLIENVPTHEKRYRNYFRIGRANKKESLRALLDEVRFTIGTARAYSNGTVPALTFPNIGSLEHRPKINLLIDCTFSYGDSSYDNALNYIRLLIPIKPPTIDFLVSEARKNAINIPLPELDIKLKIEDGDKYTFGLALHLNEPLRVVVKSHLFRTSVFIPLPAPSLDIRIAARKEIRITAPVPMPILDLIAKPVRSISLTATMPDFSTAITTPTRIQIDLAFTPPEIDLWITQNDGVTETSIKGGIPAPKVDLLLSPPSINLAIHVYEPLINLWMTTNNGANSITIDGALPAPELNLFISPPSINLTIPVYAPEIDLWATAGNGINSVIIGGALPAIEIAFLASPPSINLAIPVYEPLIILWITASNVMDSITIDCALPIPELHFSLSPPSINLTIPVYAPEIDLWATAGNGINSVTIDGGMIPPKISLDILFAVRDVDLWIDLPIPQLSIAAKEVSSVLISIPLPPPEIQIEITHCETGIIDISIPLPALSLVISVDKVIHINGTLDTPWITINITPPSFATIESWFASLISGSINSLTIDGVFLPPEMQIGLVRHITGIMDISVPPPALSLDISTEKVIRINVALNTPWITINITPPEIWFTSLIIG
jgi:hypothetical protein